MTQLPPQNSPTSEPNKQPEVRAGLPLTDAEKKAQAEKLQQQQPNGNIKA